MIDPRGTKRKEVHISIIGKSVPESSNRQLNIIVA